MHVYRILPIFTLHVVVSRVDLYRRNNVATYDQRYHQDACFLPQHQCRTCYGVVCAACSKHKVPISDPSSKPERVCDGCFDIISTRESELIFIGRTQAILWLE